MVPKFTMSATSPACNGSMSTQPPGNPKHAAYAAQILKLRRTQEFQLPRCLQQLANEAGGHPRTDLTLRSSWWPSPPGPSQLRPRRPCPRCAPSIGPQRSSTDNSGSSPRLLSCITSPRRGGPRELPKLAVAHRPGPCWVRTASAAAGPQRAPAVNVGESASQDRGPLTVSTLNDEATRRWVRIPPHNRHRLIGCLPPRPVVTGVGSHPPAVLVAVAATPSQVRPQRLCPGEGGGLARV
jgi:hypothetical protein